MNSELDDFFYTPVPEELWHYTTISGFEGIVSSGTIWATEAHHTTDASEFIHAREVGATFLKRMETPDKPAHEAKRAAADLLRDAYEGTLSPDQTEVFVASFSSARDLRSQWMSYADEAKGVSIALDLRAIRPPRELRYAVTLAPCVYDTIEKETLLREALAHIMDITSNIYRQMEDPAWRGTFIRNESLIDRIYGIRTTSRERIPAAQEVYAAMLRPAAIQSTYELLRVASHCKHHTFFEEKEWRLALPHKKTKPLTLSTVEYRSALMIPYIAHKIGGLDRLPITGVMLGAHCTEQDRVVKALEQHGYKVPITYSELPVRRR